MVSKVATSSTSLKARAQARASRPRPWASSITTTRRPAAVIEPSITTAPVIQPPAPVPLRSSRLPMMRASAAAMTQVALSRPAIIATIQAQSQTFQGSRPGGQSKTYIPMSRSSSSILSQVHPNYHIRPRGKKRGRISQLLSALNEACLLELQMISEEKVESRTSTTTTATNFGNGDEQDSCSANEKGMRGSRVLEENLEEPALVRYFGLYFDNRRC